MKKLLIIFLVLLMVNTHVYANINNYSKPNWTISISQFTKQLITSLGYTDKSKTSDNYMFYINKAKELKILNEDGIQNYNKCITRGEIAKMIVCTLKEKYPKNMHLYINQIRDYHYTKNKLQEYILKAYVKGIITGYDNKTIKADQNATISESQIIIERMLDKNKRVLPPKPNENLNVLYKYEMPPVMTPVESVPPYARINEDFTVSAEQSYSTEEIVEFRHQVSYDNMNNWNDISTKESFSQRFQKEGLVFYRTIVKNNKGVWSDWSLPSVITIGKGVSKDLDPFIAMPDLIYEGVPFKVNTNKSVIIDKNEKLSLIEAVSKGIVNYSFNSSTPYKGNLTAIGGEIYFENPGIHIASLQLIKNNKTDSIHKVFRVLPTPYINTELKGERKENRLLSWDFKKDIFHVECPINLNKSYIKVVNLMTGEEALFNKDISNSKNIKGKSFINNEIKFIIKKSGIYKVVKYVEDSRGKSCSKELIIEIHEDEPPAAKINLLDKYYRNEKGIITFEIKKEGYSPDKDRLQSNFIYYKIDSDNDGLFNDEENRVFSNSLSENSKIFSHNNVGKIQFTYIIRENYDTLLNYVTVDDFLCDRLIKVVDIQNYAPNTRLEFSNIYNVNMKVYGSDSDELKTNLNKLVTTVNNQKHIKLNISDLSDHTFNKVDNVNYIIIFDDKKVNYSQLKKYLNEVKNIKVIWVGPSSMGYEISNATGGLYINHMNLKNAFSQIKDYLLAELPLYLSSSYLYNVKGDPINYKTFYSDPENDPINEIDGKLWRYTLNINELYKDGIPPWNNKWLNKELEAINYSGEYLVEYKAKDCVCKDKQFNSYNKWSSVEAGNIRVTDKSLLTVDLSINPEYPTPVAPGKNLSVSAMTFSTSVPEKVEVWIDENKKLKLIKTKIQGNKTFWSGTITIPNNYRGDYIIYSKAYMGSKTAKDQDLVKVFINRNPDVKIESKSPLHIYEGDDVEVNINVYDPDIEILNLDLKVYLNGILIINDNKEIKPPYKLIDYNLLKNARPGKYKIEAFIKDQNGKKDTHYMSFTVNQLGIYGNVKHTQKWNENRINYNMQKMNSPNNPRTYDVFWSGEKFLLYALTTNIDGNCNLEAEKVTAEILNEGYVTRMFPSNSTNWYGSLFDEDMINKWGIKEPEKLTFRFTAYYSNNTIKTKDVKIIVDNTQKQWKVKKIN